MNLKKAIEIKQRYQYILQDATLPELIEADHLSIEALKRIEILRHFFEAQACLPLPGETKEPD